MVQINIEYQGDLHSSAQHAPSGTILATDAPVDNEGRGESFSPTDLVATALGTCMATTMGIYARRKEIDLRGMKIVVQKEMTPPPRKIARLSVAITLPIPASVDLHRTLEKTALTCPVYQCLHPDVEKPVTFHWADEPVEANR